MNFPNIKKPVYPIDEEHEDHTYKGETDGITVLTRPRTTKTVIAFTLNWTALPASDMNTLRTFFDTTARGNALEFYWTHPADGGSYSGKTFKVRFDGNLKFSLAEPGRYKGSLKLKGYEVTT